MSSCKISRWKNINKKGKSFFVLNLQYYHEGVIIIYQYYESKFNMNVQSNI